MDEKQQTLMANFKKKKLMHPCTKPLAHLCMHSHLSVAFDVATCKPMRSAEIVQGIPVWLLIKNSFSLLPIALSRQTACLAVDFSYQRMARTQ